MAITSSTFTQEPLQSDGRRWVEEVHTDHLGLKHIFRYLCSVGDDPATIMAARVAPLVAYLRESEIDTNLANILESGSFATVTTKFSTNLQNFNALRVAYKEATHQQAIMVADFLASLPDTALRNAFNMTQVQVDNLRANKLTPAASIATSIRDATGA